MSVMLRFCDTAGMPSRHAPPAVRHPLKPSRTVAACLCALWLLAAMLLLAWALNLQAGWWPAAVAVAVCLVAAAGMRRWWDRVGGGVTSPGGHLSPGGPS